MMQKMQKLIGNKAQLSLESNMNVVSTTWDNRDSIVFSFSLLYLYYYSKFQ